jgi:chromate transport protein ChrA
MRLLALVVVFVPIGAVAFGGIGAARALIDRELVQRGGTLTPDDVTEALARTKLLTGSTVVHVRVLTGLHARRLAGVAPRRVLPSSRRRPG